MIVRMKERISLPERFPEPEFLRKFVFKSGSEGLSDLLTNQV